MLRHVAGWDPPSQVWPCHQCGALVKDEDLPEHAKAHPKWALKLAGILWRAADRVECLARFLESVTR
jgi:hypothetical protein